jgi:hypothetical protein
MAKIGATSKIRHKAHVQDLDPEGLAYRVPGELAGAYQGYRLSDTKNGPRGAPLGTVL